MESVKIQNVSLCNPVMVHCKRVYLLLFTTTTTCSILNVKMVAQNFSKSSFLTEIEPFCWSSS